MQEQDGESEPPHHARRPMNAFLIFCKRHRSVVRDKYPNLENRSITKILGEWWANLEKEEKACYTSLAKQYKDAFFNANPDFKWYKLPAPPLRTLAPRPRDPDKPDDPHGAPRAGPGVPLADPDLEKTNNNSTKVDLNRKPAPRSPAPARDAPSMFTPGKLADEAHMGGLSSLLATKTEPHSPNPYYSPPSCKMNDLRCQSIFENVKAKGAAKEESIRELQDALSETSKMFEDLDEQRRRGDQLTNQDMIDQIVDKRYSRDDDSKNWADDADKGRSCKGKRYQEFMAIGGLIVTKRQKRDYSDKAGDDEFATYGWEPGTSHSEDSTAADEGAQSATTSPDPDPGRDPDPASKPFKPADFDLDAKIRALPSLSLERFQQKKRENKRRKKSAGARGRGSPPARSDPAVGSQKRKPRKVSITRLEVGGLAAPAAGAPAAGGPAGGSAGAPPAADLLALATLAEVAARTSRLDHRLLADYAATRNDDCASKV